MKDVKKNILVVEDEELLLTLIRDELLEQGCLVMVSRTGEGAMKIIEDKYDVIDLIVLDLMLPTIDGFEILQRVKAEDKYANIPVVVLSNLGDDDNIKKALDLGVTGYFIKSDMTPEKVAEIVKKSW